MRAQRRGAWRTGTGAAAAMLLAAVVCAQPPGLKSKSKPKAAPPAKSAPAAGVPLLVKAAQGHADGYVRFRALVLLSGFNDPKTAPVFMAALRDENDRLREVAYAYVEDHPDPSFGPRLLQALEREQAEFVRPALIRALGAHKAAYALAELTAIARQDGPLQDDAVRAIGQVGDPKALATLAAVQRDASRELQPTVAAAICGLGSNCDGHTRFVRESLVFAAQNIGYQELARSSSTALADLSANGRRDALPALFEIGMPANDPVRAPIALAVGRAVIRTPSQLLAIVPGLPRQEATLLLRDAFDMLEEDYAEERFFAAVRRQYWESAADGPTRAAAQVLITALEF